MNIIEQLQLAAAKRKIEETERPIKMTPSDVNLRGSGLTKKLMAKQDAQIRREEKQSLDSSAQKHAALEANRHLRESVDHTAMLIQQDYIKGKGITLDESQVSAVEGLKRNRFGVLIGPAGSGKTTLENILIQEIMKTTKLESVAFAAFTGRATQQMRRALPENLHKNVSTIHTLLEFAPDEEAYEEYDKFSRGMIQKTRRIFRPFRDASNKLTQTVFFFDEAGMIGVRLWNQFMDACPENARIYLIGDIHQLPPVMDKSILGYAMNQWPVFELKKIHRQNDGNAIIENAHRILHGEGMKNAKNFHLLNKLGDTPVPTGSSGCQTFVVQMLSVLQKKGLFDPIRDAFIVPQNISPIGQEELNVHLMMLFNPPKVENGITVNKRYDIHTGTDRKALALGDKMMVNSNINTVVPPITNGMIGVIESINLNGKYNQKHSQFVESSDDEINLDGLDDAENLADLMKEIGGEDEPEEKESRDQRQASHVTTIRFEDGRTLACSTAGDYRRIQHAYAITCHKAQGGEYPNVVILVHSANYTMLSQEWLYTAVTRARENVYIIFNNKGMTIALSKQKIKGHTLQEKIKAYNISAGTMNELTGEVVFPEGHPILPPAQKLEG